MSKTIPRLLIVGFVAAQLVWMLMPHFGSRVSPRMMQALTTHQSSSKSEQDAAISEAERQDTADASRKAIVIIVLVASVDIALVYLFWNYGTRKTTA